VTCKIQNEKEGRMRKGAVSDSEPSLSHFCAPDGNIIEPINGNIKAVEHILNRYLDY